jgi:AmpD protein
MSSRKEIPHAVERGVGARRVPSPHHDCRPDEETPSLLVVHNISLPPGEFGGPWIDALFTGTLDPHAHPFFAEIAHLRVSAHCLIRRDGEIVQYVPFDKRASPVIRDANAAMTFPSA